jgi:hypothetical protein
MSDFEGYPREIVDLRVTEETSNGAIELSNGNAWSSKRRARLKAAVDVETGEVRFYIDPEDVKKLLPKRPREPKN